MITNKIKLFAKKHRTPLLFIGGIIIGVAVTTIVLKTKKTFIIKQIQQLEQIPEWVGKWKAHCNNLNLLYENGLPIFANPEMTMVYRDAISKHASIPELIEQGFQIIDRV